MYPTGEALNLVVKVGLHEEGAYKKAWNLLKDHYSNSFEAFSECVAHGGGVAARRLIGRVEALVERTARWFLFAATAVLLIEQMDAFTRKQFRASREDDSIPALEEAAKFFLRKVKPWEEDSADEGAKRKRTSAEARLTTEVAGTSGCTPRDKDGKRRSPAAKKTTREHEQGALLQLDQGNGARQVGFPSAARAVVCGGRQHDANGMWERWKSR